MFNNSDFDEFKFVKNEENKYEGHSTIARSLANSAIVQPLIDQKVITAVGKKNGIAFSSALQNGGIYKNTTIMGGNTIFGSGPFDMIPGFSNLKDKWFLKKTGDYSNSKAFTILGKNFNLNYVSDNAHKKILDQTGVPKSVGEPFTKLYPDYGVEKIKNAQSYGTKATKTLENVPTPIRGTENFAKAPIGKKKIIEETVENVTPVVKDKVLKEVTSNANVIAQGNYDNIIQTGIGFSENYSDFFKALDSDGTLGAKIADDLGFATLEKGMKASTSKQSVDIVRGNTIQHIKNMDNKQLIKLQEGLKEAGVIKKDIIVNDRSAKLITADYTAKTATKVQKQLDSIDQIQKAIETVEAGTKRGGVQRKELKKIYKSLTEEQKKIVQTVSTTKNTTNESFKKTIKTVLEENKKNLLGNLDEIASNVDAKKLEHAEKLFKKNSKSVIDAVDNHFFNSTKGALGVVDDLFSSRIMRVLTGNYVPASIALPVAVVTTTLSALASSHQTEAISNFRSFQTNEHSSTRDRYSEEAEVSSYNHRGLTQSNEEDMHYIKHSQNIAKKYFRDISNIEIDRKESSLSSFTTY